MRKSAELAGVAPASPARSLKLGGAALLLAALVAWVAHACADFLLGYAVSAIIAFAAAFLAPAIAGAVGFAGAPHHDADRHRRCGSGADAFTRNTGRSAVAIAALGMALANVVNAGVFVESMKHSTLNWFERAVRADVFVFAGTRVQARNDAPAARRGRRRRCARCRASRSSTASAWCAIATATSRSTSASHELRGYRQLQRVPGRGRRHRERDGRDGGGTCDGGERVVRARVQRGRR